MERKDDHLRYVFLALNLAMFRKIDLTYQNDSVAESFSMSSMNLWYAESSSARSSNDCRSGLIHQTTCRERTRLVREASGLNCWRASSSVV